MKRLPWIICAVYLLCLPSSGFAYWIWTPKSGKWVNPKLEVKATPQDQLAFAVSLFEGKSYEEAAKEFKKLIRNFPKAAEAAEAQFYLGQIEEAKNRLYEAFLAYQKVVEKYPFSGRINDVLARQYYIGEVFMSGEKRKAMGVSLPVENPAIEIFTKVAENSPYSPLAAKSYYKLGLVLKSLQRYDEAEDAFERLIKNYPESEWVEAATFQLAACRAALSRSPDYDQVATREAREKFEAFLREHPDAVLSDEAESSIRELELKEAESRYRTALFYEKQKAYEAARIYYEEVIDGYARTPWAAKAMERLEIMEQRR